MNVPWYEESFNQDYLTVFEPYFEAHTDKEVEFICRECPPQQFPRLLDLACGNGRHSVRLGEKGYKVTGVDLCQDYLDIARREADKRGVEAEWIRADMLTIDFDQEFDLVIQMLGAFGYFEDERENVEVLRLVHRALRPGGRFLLDIENRDWLEAHHSRRVRTMWLPECLVRERARFDPETGVSLLTYQLRPHDGGRPREYTYRLRLYSPREIQQLFSQTGFEILRQEGGFEGQPADPANPRLVTLAQKVLTDL